MNMNEGKKPKLGSGKRFKKLEKKLGSKVDNPGAVAASIGRKKYGKKKFQQLASAGKRKKSKTQKESVNYIRSVIREEIENIFNNLI